MKALNIKKGIFILIFLVYTVSIGFAQAEDARKVREIRQRGYLIVGMVATDQHPFFYIDSLGQFAGLDVDIAQTVADNIGVELRINREAKSFNDLIPLVVNRKIDFASSKLSQTLARAKKVSYTTPYIIFRQALLLNRLQLARAGLDDNKIAVYLKNRFDGTIGVIENSSYQRYAKLNFPKTDVVAFPNWEMVVDAGIKGEVFAIYRDEMEIFKIMQKYPSTNLTLKPVILSDQLDPIAVAVHPDETHFLLYLNTILENMNIEQNVNKLLKLYQE